MQLYLSSVSGSVFWHTMAQIILPETSCTANRFESKISPWTICTDYIPASMGIPFDAYTVDRLHQAQLRVVLSSNILRWKVEIPIRDRVRFSRCSSCPLEPGFLLLVSILLLNAFCRSLDCSRNVLGVVRHRRHQRSWTQHQ